ncbi:hypothetical protein [Streptomyces griseorubiginosus]|uniref:hypothetical protein n=1 Tax=Streptomyces griseorubiginosus TaxID=67304 RepID=UPI002E8179BE|nr:hypothetical protein [Streptomyces griseorubiginosus]WUB49771.1 hypothetical protein OHN19_43120 [Streptomyces griseorubiginosus]WUB58300.1 hypothetical protein OG942_43130 [Streptomyces griseorubiginosus]
MDSLGLLVLSTVTPATHHAKDVVVLPCCWVVERSRAWMMAVRRARDCERLSRI